MRGNGRGRQSEWVSTWGRLRKSDLEELRSVAEVARTRRQEDRQMQTTPTTLQPPQKSTGGSRRQTLHGKCSLGTARDVTSPWHGGFYNSEMWADIAASFTKPRSEPKRGSKGLPVSETEVEDMVQSATAGN